MLWLILRVLLFAALLAVIAIGGAYIVDSPGAIVISWQGVEYPPLSHLEFLGLIAIAMAAIFVLYKVLGIAMAVMRFLLGDETALSRYWTRSREKRGLEALSRGLIALAEGEAEAAESHARKATRLLGSRELTALLNAQIAEAKGDSGAARDQYRALAKDPKTAVVGVKGLLGQAVRQGEIARALRFAEHAFALRPRDRSVQQGLFELQVRNRSWDGARKTLRAMVKSRTITADVAKRRGAILDFEHARSLAATGDEAEAATLAEAAVAAVPTFVPAAAFAARLLAAAGNTRRALRILRDAWSEAPQPDLAAALASFEPDETPAQRRRRFRDLIASNPEHEESRLLEADLAIADLDVAAARKALGDLASERPTQRSLALMGAIERVAGSPDNVVRAYMARAVTAPRGAQWTCDRCAATPGHWSAVCPACGAFDTLDWREPAAEPAGMADPGMMPLLLDAGDPIAGRLAADDDIEDAETARA